MIIDLISLYTSRYQQDTLICELQKSGWNVDCCLTLNIIKTTIFSGIRPSEASNIM